MDQMPFRSLILGLTLCLLVACSRGEPEVAPTATTAPAGPATAMANLTGLAAVDSLSLSQNPDQTLTVSAKGHLRDGCTVIDEIATGQTDTTFLITITTVRPADMACTQALVPFEQNITLDLSGRTAGIYTVDVNGVSAQFTLTPPPTATPINGPTATPTLMVAGSGSGQIRGLVVHDICAVAGGEGGQPLELGPGCVEYEDGGFGADGILATDEPGLPDIIIDLGAGACPATGLASTTTDNLGAYSFEDLPSGVYCISIDVGAGKNEVLLPGFWTVPELEIGAATITLLPNALVSDVDFGWDYQGLPLLTVNPPDCRNALFFVEDLTIPDDTAVQPNEIFVKIWRLQNSGTCIWTTDYQIIFAGGEQMSNDTSFPLPVQVPAGEFVEISLTLIAPAAEGTYRSDFVLADEAGVRFGAGADDSDSFWVQIVVDEAAATPEPNSADIGGVLWADDDGDGSFDSFEAPIEGVTVRLSDRPCPADGIVNNTYVVATAVTDDMGRYRFENLPADTYCVSIAPFALANVEILIPGDWTYPAQGVGLFTIILNEGVTADDIDFGWRYQ